MPITFDKRNKRWRYHFDRVINGSRQRTSRLLPKGFTREEALDYDLVTTKKTFTAASGLSQQARLISEAVRLYLGDKEHLRNHYNMTIQLKLMSDFYKGKTLDQLAEVATAYRTEAAREDGKGALKPATIRNRIAYLRAACRYAWRKGKGFWCAHDPAETVIVPQVDNKRHYYPSLKEVKLITSKIKNEQAEAACWIAFYSGMRQAEVKGTGIGFQTFDIPPELSKNGLPRNVPVHPKLVRILKNKTLWPIQISVWTISKHFKAAAREVGLGHLRFHDLRHGTASEMINGGADLFTVGQVLGHKSTQSTQRYAHLRQDKLKEAVDLVGKKPRTKGARQLRQKA